MPDPQAKRRILRAGAVCLTYSFAITCTWLLNVTAYPSFDGYFPLARDIATVFGGVVCAALIPLAMRRPQVLLGPAAPLVAGAACLLGASGMFVASGLASPAVATLFACLRAFGASVAGIYLVLCLVGLDGRERILVLVGAFVLKYVWMGCLLPAPVWAQSALFVVLSGVYPLAMGRIGSDMAREVAGQGAPESLSVTNPLSFVPLTSKLFAAVLLCSAAFGFALTYSSQNSYPRSTFFALVFIVLAALWVLRRPKLSVDTLFSFVFALVLAGILFGMTGMRGTLSGSVANTLLQAGSDVTSIVVWYMVASLGERNRSGVVVSVLGVGLIQALGTELGAASGHLENHLLVVAPEVGGLFMAGIALGFALWFYHLARTFSFDATIEAVRPAQEVEQMGESDVRVPDIERRCAELSERAGLTPRESEVLDLLARGRNAAYIQDKLTISRNTVKSYVARVYGKLDVHSHQELIDLVEAGAASFVPAQ